MGEFWDILKLHLYVLVIFYTIYTIGFYVDPDGWTGIDKNESLLFLHSFYFVFTTHTTVGLGDIFPKRLLWRMIMTIHIAIVYVLTIIGITDLLKMGEPVLQKVRQISSKITSFSPTNNTSVAGIKKLKIDIPKSIA